MTRPTFSKMHSYVALVLVLVALNPSGAQASALADPHTLIPLLKEQLKQLNRKGALGRGAIDALLSSCRSKFGDQPERCAALMDSGGGSPPAVRSQLIDGLANALLSESTPPRIPAACQDIPIPAQPSVSLEARIQGLVNSGFRSVGLESETALITQSIELQRANGKQDLLCRELVRRLRVMACVAAPTTDCQREEAGGEVLVVERNVLLRTHLAQLGPFLGIALEEELGSIRRAGGDVEALQEALASTVDSALSQFARWRTAEAVVLIVREQPEAVVDLLGLEGQSWEALAPKLPIERLPPNDRHAFVRGNATVLDDLAREVRSRIASLQGGAGQQGRRFWQALGDGPADGALAVVLEPTGMQAGQVLHRATFELLRKAAHEVLISGCMAKPGECSDDDDVKPQQPDSGERIDLGLAIEKVAVHAGGYKYVGGGAIAAIRVDTTRLESALEAFGLPKGVRLGSVRGGASSDLRDVWVEFPLRILGSQGPPLRLEVIKNGRPASIRSSVAQILTSAPLEELVARALTNLSFVADQSANPSRPGFIARLDSVKTSVGASGQLEGTVELSPTGWEADEPFRLQFALSANGFEFHNVRVPAYVANHVRNLVGKAIGQAVARVESVQMLLRDANIEAMVVLSAAPLGCDVEREVRLSFPFKPGGLDGILNGLEAEAARCAEKLARRRARELAAKGLAGLNFFGLTASAEEGDCLQECRVTFSLNQDAVISGVRVAMTENSLAVDFSTGHLEAKGEQFLRGLLEKLLPFDRHQIDGLRLESDGLSFELILLDIQHIGDLHLGRIRYRVDRPGAFIRDLADGAEAALVRSLGSSIELPTVGPLEGVRPFVSPDGEVWLEAGLRVYEGLIAKCRIDLHPSFRVTLTDPLEGQLLRNVQGLISSLIPGNRNTINPGPRFEKIEEHGVWGLSFGLVVDFEFLSFTVDNVAVSSRGVLMPRKLGGRLPAGLTFGSIAVANVGFTYDTRAGQLSIEGDVTAASPELASIAKIDSTLTLPSDSLTFLLAGRLIAAESLELMRATGELAFEDARVEFKAEASPAVQAFFQPRADGVIDGKAQRITSNVALAILGLDLLNSAFDLDIRQETLAFGTAQRILIGDAELQVRSDLRFSDPHAVASVALDLGGWREGLSATLNVSAAMAHLQMSFLGIPISIQAPSVASITPQLLVEVLKSLLNVDLDFSDKPPEIKVSLMKGNGDVTTPQVQENSSDPPPEAAGGAAGAAPGGAGAERPQQGTGEAEPEGNTVSGGGSAGGVDGEYYCDEVNPNRYEIRFVPGQVRQGPLSPGFHPHRPPDAFHQATFDEQTKREVCGDGSLLRGWRPLTVRRRVSYAPCSLRTNRVASTVYQLQGDAWPQYAGREYFCGSLDVPDSSCDKAVFKAEEFQQLEEAEYEDLVENGHSPCAVPHTAFAQGLLDEAARTLSEKDLRCGPVDRFRSTICATKRGWLRKSYWASAKVQMSAPAPRWRWQQSFVLLRHAENGSVSALSMCADDLRPPSVPPDAAFAATCRPAWLPLGITLQQDEIDSKQETFLLSLADRSLRGLAGNTSRKDFAFSLDGEEYSVTQVRSESSEYTDFHVTRASQPGAPTVSVRATDEDWLAWLAPERFRNELLAELAEASDLEILHANRDANVLILRRPGMISATRIQALWMRSGKRARHVAIGRWNPYTGGTLSADQDVARVGDAFHRVLTAHDAGDGAVELLFGLDRRQGAETAAILSLQDGRYHLMWRAAGEGFLHDAPSFLDEAIEARGRIDALESCLHQTGATVSMETFVRNPSSAFVGKAAEQYPFVLLRQARCQ